ncbi:hypothetical protein Tco_0280873, partial [Tanacetum coccineum]
VMGEPLSPDCVFDFPIDEPHPAYDFFAPAPLPGYAGNPNNNNGWLTADDYLLGELEAVVDEQMVVPAVEEGKMDAPMMDMEEDLAVLFCDDDFEDDASDGFRGPSTTVAEGLSFPQVAPGLPGSDAEIASGVIIREIGWRVLAVEGQMQVMASQMIQAVDRVEQDVQRYTTRIRGEPLSPDRIFDFPMNEPHPAYDFFALAPLPEHAGNPNNNNGWLAADDYLLGELEAMMDEQMIALVVEGQMDAPMMDMEEDLAVLFGDDDFENDASDGFGEEEVWEVNEDWLMAPTTPPPVLAVPPPSIYEVGGPSTAVAEGPSFLQVALGLPMPPSVIEDLSTHLDNLEYGYEQLVQRVVQGSDAEIAAGVTIGEIGPRVLVVEGKCRIDSAGSGLAGRCVAERHADPAAVDYCYRDEQQGEHADAVHFGIGETNCSFREKTTKTPVVLKNHAMSDKSSPLKRLLIKKNVWVKFPEGENIFTLLQIFMQVTLLPLTAWRESHASRYDRVVPKRKYLRYCSEWVRLERSEKVASGSEDRWLLWTRVKTKYSRFLRWVEAEMVSHEVESKNGEDFSYRRRMLPLTYQPMAMKKTSFSEMECGGSIDISIPDTVKDQGEALSDI